MIIKKNALSNAGNEKNKILVISAVNITSGGALKILHDCVLAGKNTFCDWKIYILVNNRISLGLEGVVEIPFGYPKLFWLGRLFFEWLHSYWISLRLNADIWLCLHDITALVVARKQYVYFHNPAPFFDGRTKLIAPDFSFLMFKLFYSYLYKIFSERNSAIIVQQDWIRTKLRQRGYARTIIVSHPSKGVQSGDDFPVSSYYPRKKVVFVYPALPRPFKNHLVIIQAVKLLPVEILDKFEIIFTLDGSENRYSKLIKEECEGVRVIRFIGIQAPKQMPYIYSKCDAVLFPSLLETWGLPISESIEANRPLIVSNLPYAVETLNGYSKAILVDPSNASQWAAAIARFLNCQSEFDVVEKVIPAEPFVTGWDEFWLALKHVG
jgi:glycosyltransferase involved in cell wall biosynthesis